MSDDRLTPEERAVIEMAGRWRDHWQASLDGGDDDSTPTPWLRDAVDAYRRATAPPKPFEAYMSHIGEGHWGIPVSDLASLRNCDQPIYRVTVIPEERVR